MLLTTKGYKVPLFSAVLLQILNSSTSKTVDVHMKNDACSPGDIFQAISVSVTLSNPELYVKSFIRNMENGYALFRQFQEWWVLCNPAEHADDFYLDVALFGDANELVELMNQVESTQSVFVIPQQSSRLFLIGINLENVVSETFNRL